MQAIAVRPPRRRLGYASSHTFSASYVGARFGVEPASPSCCVFAETGRGMTGQAWGVGNRWRHTLRPLLAVLFLVSYGLLTTLVIEQNRTIDSQRSLIHLLFKDSLHLSALRKAERQKAHQPHGTGAGNKTQEGAEAPGPKIPVNQVPQQKGPSTQVPSLKSKVQNGSKSDRKQRGQKKAPSKPPAELTDPSDMRRVSVAI